MFSLIGVLYFAFLCSSNIILENSTDSSFQTNSHIKECQYDIQTYCSRHSATEFEAIDCLLEDDKKLSSISKECQHILWQRKQNLTLQGPFEQTLSENCRNVFANMNECKSLQGSKFYVSCLIEHKQNVESKKCVYHLNRIASFIFSDYHLVHNFVNSCHSDIERWKCGRLDSVPTFPPGQEPSHLTVKSQGGTIHCLRSHVRQLTEDCRMQILRIAELQSDDYHLDRTLYYACRDDRENFCRTVESGEGRVYACLSDNKYNKLLSPNCRQAIRERQELSAIDYRVNFRFVSSCTVDIAKHDCMPESSKNSPTGANLARVLLCLESVEKPHFDENGSIVSPKHLLSECKLELKKIRRDLLSDHRLSPDLMAHCESTIDRYCQSHKTAPGTVVHCLMQLMRNMPTLTHRPPTRCIESVHDLLKITDVESEVLLDPVIDRACHSLLTGRCADSREQQKRGAAFECLMAHRSHPEMPPACRKHILELYYFISRDVTLDEHLLRACAHESVTLCHMPKVVWTEDATVDPHLLTCLYNHRPSNGTGSHHRRDTTLSNACSVQVRRLMHARAADVSLEPRVFEPCLSDLAMHCNVVEDEEDYEDENDDEDDLDYGEDDPNGTKQKQIGNADESNRKHSFSLACLQDKLDVLNHECREAVVQVSAEANEDPELDKRIVEACQPAEQRFCFSEAQSSYLFECLVEHKNHPSMEPACQVAIEHLQIVALKDMRISKSFFAACHPDAELHCKLQMDRGLVQVVTCLSGVLTTHRLAQLNGKLIEPKNNRSILKPLSTACARQLRFELLQQSESIRLDPQLAQACDADLKRFCKGVPEGNAKILGCLRHYRERLSDACHTELFKREEVFALENRGDYSLMTACQQMANVHCGPVLNRLAELGEEIDEKRGHHDLLECLITAMQSENTGPSFDSICQDRLQTALLLRASDYRLDPELQEACFSDVIKFCRNEAERTLQSSHEGNGAVLHCLKKHFTLQKNEDERLSDKCRHRVSLLVRWENSMFQLDPTLASACKQDTLKLCATHLSDADHSSGVLVRECLKHALKAGKIRSTQCSAELVLSIELSKADISVDVYLISVCSVELQRFCGSISTQPGEQMACLLRNFDQNAPHFRRECAERLRDRRELQQLAFRLKEPQSLPEFVARMNASELRNVLMLTLFGLLSCIFVIGLCFGRLTKRVPIDMKNK